MALDLTLETVLRLLPDQEELEELRTALVRAGVPDPAMEWSRSGASATIDKRVVGALELDEAVTEAQRAFEEYGAQLFSSYRVLLRAHVEGRPAAVVEELVRLAERKEQAGLFESARRYLDVALSVAAPLPEKGPQVLTLRRLGRVCRAEGELLDAIRSYERSAELARDAGDVRGRAIASIGAGSVMALQGRWSDAQEHHQEALELLEVGGPAEHLLERGQIYNNLGYLAARQDRLDEAEKWLAMAISTWDVVSSPVDLAICHHCLALVKKGRGDWDQARQHYHSALDLPLPPSLHAGISIDMADLCLEAGDVESAERWGRIAEDEAISSRSPYLLGRVYQVRGNIAREGGNEDGFTFYEKALEIARERGLRLLEGETLVDYSLLRQRMEERDEARSYLVRAREIFAEVGAEAERDGADRLQESVAETVGIDALTTPADR
jgi:tetratricopeptide (TPR) repeat protein